MPEQTGLRNLPSFLPPYFTLEISLRHWGIRAWTKIFGNTVWHSGFYLEQPSLAARVVRSVLYDGQGQGFCLLAGTAAISQVVKSSTITSLERYERSIPMNLTTFSPNNDPRGRLLISGTAGHTAPDVTTKAAFKLYRNFMDVTQIERFEGRGHSLVDHGWREVALGILDWLEGQGLGAAKQNAVQAL